MPNPTVSIAMATYNGAKYIDEQLQSFTNQTVLPDELIISDDGSTDATLVIAKTFQKSAPFPVKILDNSDRIGYRKNFLRAANACQSEIIFFSDQDDIWRENKIEIMRKAFEKPDVLMAFHNAMLVDEKGNDIGPLAHTDTNNPWKTPNGLLIAFRRTLLIRTDLIDKSVDFYKTSQAFAHDQWIPLLATCFGKVLAVDDILVLYRQHAENVYGAKYFKPTLLQRFRNKFIDRSSAFLVLAETSNRINKILYEFTQEPDLPTAWKLRANLAEKAFQNLEILYKFRSGVYNSSNFLARLLALLKLTRMKAYSGTEFWTFGPKAFFRDLVLGAFLSGVLAALKVKKVSGDQNCRRLW